MSKPIPRIGLVLGAGGIAGYSFHAGALAALEQATGWDARTAEVVIGTSAGSSIAAVLRGNVPVQELVERVLSVPTDHEGMDRLRRVAGRGETKFGPEMLRPASPKLLARELVGMPRLRNHDFGAVIAAALPAGPLGTDVLREQIDVLHPDGWPEPALWIAALNLDRGGIRVFGRDEFDQEVEVGAAVAASCAIPAYFQPVRIAGDRYVDGGMRSPTNADLLADAGLDLVVILSPLSTASPDPRHPMVSLFRGIPSFQLGREVARLHRAEVPTLVLQPDDAVSRVMGINAMDPTRVVPVLAESAMAMAEHIETVDESKLDVLRTAGRRLISPPDVPYPD